VKALESLKRQWHWAGLVRLCALIAVAAFVAPSHVSELELEREAYTAADRLEAKMLKEPEVVIGALMQPGLDRKSAT
jgi:hypothetical protein